MGRQYRTGIYSNDEKTLGEIKKFIDDKQKMRKKR